MVTYVKEEFSTLDAKADTWAIRIKNYVEKDWNSRLDGGAMLTGNLLPSDIPSTAETTAEALNDDKVGVKEATAGVLGNLAMKQLLSGKRPMYLLQSGGQTVFENIK
jgi:hypothetical protein